MLPSRETHPQHEEKEQNCGKMHNGAQHSCDLRPARATRPKEYQKSKTQEGRPTPSFMIFSGLLEEAANLAHLGVKKGLQVLLLGLDVATEFRALSLQLVLN